MRVCYLAETNYLEVPVVACHQNGRWWWWFTGDTGTFLGHSWTQFKCCIFSMKRATSLSFHLSLWIEVILHCLRCVSQLTTDHARPEVTLSYTIESSARYQGVKWKTVKDMRTAEICAITLMIAKKPLKQYFLCLILMMKKKMQMLTLSGYRVVN